MPIWLGGRAWEIKVSWAISGWKSSLKAWRVKPFDDPLFKAARDGDIDEIQSLIARGQASLFDRTPNGENLLHVLKPARSHVSKIFVSETPARMLRYSRFWHALTVSHGFVLDKCSRRGTVPHKIYSTYTVGLRSLGASNGVLLPRFSFSGNQSVARHG
jgi:hypothetical protein